MQLQARLFDGERHHRVEPRRAETSAHDQQAQRAFAARETVCRRRLHDDIGAHRIADDSRLDAGGKGFRKRREHVAREMREQAVRITRDGILFMDHQRAAREPGRDATGAGHESAEAHHQRGPATAHHAECLPDRPQQLERRGQQCDQALAAQTAHRQPLDGDVLGRHHARLEAALRAQPHHFVRGGAQQPRQRQRREHMSTGAAGHDEHEARLTHASSSRGAQRARVAGAAPFERRTVAMPRELCMAS